MSLVLISFTIYQVQDLLLEYGLENVAEILIEGLSRVKRCTDEGRVLMSLDLQVLIIYDDVSSGKDLQVLISFTNFRC